MSMKNGSMDITSNKTLFTISHDEPIHSHRLNKEKGLLATASRYDNSIKIWSMHDGALVTTISSFEQPEIVGWCDDQLLVKHDHHHKLALFDANNKTTISEIACNTSIVSVDQLHNNKNILVRTFAAEIFVVG